MNYDEETLSEAKELFVLTQGLGGSNAGIIEWNEFLEIMKMTTEKSRERKNRQNDPEEYIR